jgi:hypothetical protein
MKTKKQKNPAQVGFSTNLVRNFSRLNKIVPPKNNLILSEQSEQFNFSPQATLPASNALPRAARSHLSPLPSPLTQLSQVSQVSQVSQPSPPFPITSIILQIPVFVVFLHKIKQNFLLTRKYHYDTIN